MDLNFQKINGTNTSLDYESLTGSIKTKLELTCKKAEIIILNNFPVAVSSQSTVDFIILIHIPKNNNSYYKVELDDDKVYVKNQIIAVSLIKEFDNPDVEECPSGVTINGVLTDFEDQANELKWSLTNYLANSCGLSRNKITVHPLFWLKSNKSTFTTNHLVVSDKLIYDEIESVISNNYYFKYSGYADWNNSDIVFDHSVQMIFEQASKDSETGYITKKKIERFHTRFDTASQKAYDNIGSQLVEVKGKAGTGKSSDLLKWMLNSSLANKPGVFLTYNHLLVYDVAKQIQSFHNHLSEEKKEEKRTTTTNTLHSFFYNVAKKLGVLMLLSEDRIIELSTLLDKRWLLIEKYFDKCRREELGMSLAKLRMYVQRDRELDEGTKREAIDFIRFIESYHKFLGDKLSVNSFYEDYRAGKILKLGKLESSNVFLADYNKVLERIELATSDLDKFLKDLNVQDKFELLENVMKLNSSILDKSGNGKINSDALKNRYQNSLKGFRHGRIVYVDEAHDCHPHERDILFNLFGSQNVVIANGDKEQLIRYSEVCDWKVSKTKKIDHHGYTKKRQSYRMKPAIAALANHIATYYDIDLNIEPIETEDHGAIIIDYESNTQHQITMVKKLYQIGERQGCSPYESLLLLKTAENGSYSDITSNDDSSVSINEFGNIIKSKKNTRAEWDLIKKASTEIEEFIFWNTTGEIDKKEISVPGNYSVRSIYYQSCRGIEAWTVMCYNLDEFFDRKINEDNAENYLLNDLFDQLTPDARKNKYAATWVLMAVTRAMENCYINLSDSTSSISMCIKEFENKFPQYISNN